ncbi:hypothetical protein ALC56_12284 [Trachymyrmex septentrionalis]|uniref:Acyl-CoA-binding domain-containing protein 5 n=2 Tax=Trachymyrmex septentrionalis TaxID=34720 RepID=A0A195F085_9HYME|nr:hypothetical protein ALC56_12284 [Trachymyrmex septentrionalis]
MSYTDNVATFLGSLDSFYESVPAEDLELLVGPVLERIRSQPGSPLSGSPLVSRETSPHRVMNASRHITSSLETSPTSSRTASPLPQDTDGEEEEFIDTVESAPERAQKDALKSTIASQKVQTTAKNGIDHSSTENVIKENTELTNGYSNTNGHAQTISENHRERSRQRTKKDDNKANAEFLNQIATTMQHLQRDLDRITARVRGLEGQALQALAPSTEHIVRRKYLKWWPLQECPPRLFVLLILWPFVAHLLINFMQRYRQRRL